MFRRKMVPCQTTEALVTVTKYEDGVIEAVLRHPRLKEPQKINSISQLILVMDCLLDLEECPDNPIPLVMPIMVKEEIIATFQIQVLFREIYSWQGRLVWVERKEEASFRSVLELMKLLDDILAT